MISLLVVNYRSAALAAKAIRTARAATSSPLQVVVVDNSCDAREAEALRGVADTLIVSETNRGYAGGINARPPRVRRRRRSSSPIPTSPSRRDRIDRLRDALDGDAAVAGPALFWDDAHRWIFRPAISTPRRRSSIEVLASRSRAWREQRDRRRFRQRVAFWSLDETTRVRMLSGAVMAIRAARLRRPRRLRRALSAVLRGDRLSPPRRASAASASSYVPAARCRHIYNQSAAQASEMRRRATPHRRCAVSREVERPLPRARAEAPGTSRRAASSRRGSIGSRCDDRADEPTSSPKPPRSPTFDTAAGHFGHAATTSRRRSAPSLGGSELYLRVVAREHGRSPRHV